MKEKTDTWMPLYIGDYLADTSHLSTLEHGAYLLLLMAYWRKKGPIPDDDVKLARMAGLSLKQWRAIRSNVVELFLQGDGQLVSTRAQRELDNARAKSEKARANALERYKEHTADADDPQSGRTATDLLTGAPPPASPSPSPVPMEHKSKIRAESRPDTEEEFQTWYAAYPRRVDPGRARKAYASARKKIDPGALLVAAQAYAVECEDREKQYIKHPATWLNAESWQNHAAPESGLPLLSLAVDNTPRKFDPFEEDNQKWRDKVRFFYERGFWSRNYDGPAPDEPYCEVPADILAEFKAKAAS